MEHFIKYVHIKNFKSIADLRLEDCKRINLFLGYPNVGKSNVLEALGLFSVPFLDYKESLKKLIRIENKSELFYDLTDNKCHISTDAKSIGIQLKENLSILLNKQRYYHLSTDNKMGRKTPFAHGAPKKNIPNNIKRYIFKSDNKWKSNKDNQLFPPFGENIIDVLSYNPNVSEVKAWMKQEFKKFGLEYVLDKSSNSLKVQKRLNDDEVFILPYSSIADTLQRLIFYKTAIASNKNSVLLFEEPEAHAFPPYISDMTHDVINAKTNQFFMVTHSPFIVNDFIEKEDVRRETAIYVFDYRDNQTVVKRLTDKDVDEVYNYGLDMFFGIERYLRNEQ